MPRKITNEIFINEVAIVHNGFYKYDKTKYTKMHDKIIVTCPKHGEFEQIAQDHKKGSGCKHCRTDKMKTLLSSDNEEFIKKAKTIFGDEYSYSKVIYLNNWSNVVITCKKHGDFPRTPNAHVSQKQGCPKCRYIKSSSNKTKTNEQFIIDSKKTHGNTYSYSKTKYIKDSEEVTITCKVHGDFKKVANNHIYGQGCQKCAKYGFNQSKPGIMYYLSINNGEAYKIGITNKSVNERFHVNELHKIDVIKIWNFNIGAQAFAKELEIKREFKKYQYQGDKLLSSGNTELFTKDILRLDNERREKTKHSNTDETAVKISEP